MGSVEVSPGIGFADAIFDIVSSGSTLVSNNLKEVEVVMRSEAIMIAHKGLTTEKKEILMNCYSVLTLTKMLMAKIYCSQYP